MIRATIATVALYASSASAAPPVEAYGNLPDFESMALSPDGRKVAMVRRDSASGEQALVIHEFGKGAIGGAKLGALKARGVEFAGPNFVLLRASSTRSLYGYFGRLEFSSAFAYSLARKDVDVLLATSDEIHLGQSGLGRVLGVSSDGRRVFMPAFVSAFSAGGDPTYGYFSVDLETGVGSLRAKGEHDTTDWYVTPDGEAFLREDYDDESDRFSVLTRSGTNWKPIYSEVDPFMPTSIGLMDAGKTLLLSGSAEDDAQLRLLNLETGAITPFVNKAAYEVVNVVVDQNRHIHGFEIGGPLGEYKMFDPALDRILKALAQSIAAQSVELVSWSDGFRKLLVRTSGTGDSGTYRVYDGDAKTLTTLAQERPQIAPADVGAVVTIEYKARDGLKIPAVLTFPPGAGLEGGAPLPTIVLPHGGPASHDKAGFDWLAQYFASRGYLVLQPNFRGSTGYTRALREAGAGEWGGKMLTDIADGLALLVRTKKADAARVCIVGLSYGGYAALQSVVTDAGAYKCAAAVGAVTDLPAMLSAKQDRFDKDHWVFSYWAELMGGTKSDSDMLKAISPARRAAEIKAPVLLIHGRDDLVVPYSQSERMKKALEEAGKSVEFVSLKGEDHWLSRSETRLQTLKTLGAFVEKHIGAKP